MNAPPMILFRTISRIKEIGRQRAFKSLQRFIVKVESVTISSADVEAKMGIICKCVTLLLSHARSI